MAHANITPHCHTDCVMYITVVIVHYHLLRLAPNSVLHSSIVINIFYTLLVNSRYSSRQAFCRTVAVMSIVGYIVGLGDRHGENILLDSTNGDCVHVDLSCLFNKV